MRSQTVHGGGHAGRRLVEGEELKIQQFNCLIELI